MSTRDRGFASMPQEKVREIASLGGKAAHTPGTNKRGLPRRRGHEWTAEEAQAAGRKGGMVSRGGKGRTQPLAAPHIAGAESAAESASAGTGSGADL